MYSKISKFLRDERGATSIEYGLIAAGIGIALISVVSTVGDSVKDLFNGFKVKLDEFNSTNFPAT
jgi:pilus assembly protein Flp/PilA